MILEITPSRALIQAGWHATSREKACILCGERKPIDAFYSYGYTTNQGKRSIRYESRCRPCAQDRRRKDHRANANRNKAVSKRWRESRPDYVAKKAAEYRATDHGKGVKAKLQRLRKARMRSGQGDNLAIRAIYSEAMRIERLVAACPVFALPELGHKMHVDHVVPLARGGQHHEDNLQIIPIGINMRKGVKCQ
jgi:5-methylcytosine-specific restriction endonuclease McrA